MEFSLEQAKAELASRTTIDGLFNLVRDTSARVEGAADNVTSLLYGGKVFLDESFDISKAFVDSTINETGANRLVRVDQSSVGELLFSSEFKGRLTSVIRADLANAIPGFSELTDTEQGKLVSNRFSEIYANKDAQGNRLPVDPAKPSLFDIASKNFVDQAQGNFRVVAGTVSESSVLLQTELPALLAKTGNPMVDGVSLDQLKSAGVEGGTNAVLSNAITQTHLSLDDLSPESLNKYKNFTPDQVEAELSKGNKLSLLSGVVDYLPSDLRDRFHVGQSVMQEAGERLAKNGLVKGLNKIGFVGGLLGLLITSKAAAAEMEKGNPEEAKRLMEDWAVDAAGSEIGGIIGAAVVGIAVALAATAGLVLSAPLVAVLVFGGMLVGGFLGADAALDLSHSLGGITSFVGSLFADARNFIIRRDPLVLDLDGDGLELSAASGNTLFDHNADGIKTGTGWARPDDGFLVRDLDGNVTIDTGRELFGVDTIKSNGALATQGFDALADLDTNNDGFITSADAAFGELKIWQDTNQDGISQASELKTLAQLNITSIGVNGSTSGPQAGQVINNNSVALSATYTKGGQTRTVGAIDLEANNFFTEFPPEVVDEAGNPVTITTHAQALPQMNGSGMVRNMRAANDFTFKQRA
jgi:hypothetical protein